MNSEVAIPTPDGAARAYVFHPPGAGPWPAVIFYMDAPAIRPALFQMCERLADEGYFVLLPDMFWRAGPYEPINLAEAFKDEAARRAIFGKFMASTDPRKAMSDTGAFLAWLSRQARVKGEKVGATGYCMGAGMALRAAGTFPDRIVAVGGFHGGRLATDAPDSPHLLIPKMKAGVYCAVADNDDKRDPAAKEVLRSTFAKASVAARVAVYEGANHGWCVKGSAAYDDASAERAWAELTALYKTLA